MYYQHILAQDKVDQRFEDTAEDGKELPWSRKSVDSRWKSEGSNKQSKKKEKGDTPKTDQAVIFICKQKTGTLKRKWCVETFLFIPKCITAFSTFAKLPYFATVIS